MAIIPAIMGMLGAGKRPAVPQITSVVDRVSQELLAIDGLGRVTLDTIRTGQPARVCVAARGWSPSLHWINLKFKADVDLTQSPGRIAADILQAIAPGVERQRLRSKAAHDMFGRIVPLDVGFAADVHHMWVDASLDPLCRVAGNTLAGHLPAVVKRIHEPIMDHDGGPVHGTMAGYVEEREAPDVEGGMIREAGVLLPFDGTEGTGCEDGRPPHPPFLYDGATLSIHTDPIPETVAATLPGRPLSDLVLLHPALDRRTIASIEQAENGRHRITIRFVRELIRYRDLPR